MTSELKVFILDIRLFLMYLRKGLLKCRNQKCLRGSLKIGEIVVSRMVSSGYGGKASYCRRHKTRTRRVLYHYECAKELNII